MDKNYSFYCSPVPTHNEARTKADNHNQIENDFHMNHTSKSRMWGVEGGKNREDHFHTARTYTIDKFRFNHRLKTLEANFSEFTQTNQFVGAVSSILEIVHRYMDQRMIEAVKLAIQLQSDRQKIIKEQVKEQVKVQISKVLPKIKQTVNEQLEDEVLTLSSNSSKTSYEVAADLSEMELKKILIEKIEGNKSIHRSNEQRKLYKALVEAYESDKIILDTYGDTVTLKRRHDDDADKDEEPSSGSDRGSKRRREGKEPDSASAQREKATRSAGKSTQGSKS
uniref:Uncharacterized protein n=1 Tax=Tanacetum cinerariifolium TaxID=118510 RepID=A0A699GNA9_TANCI|nr:hypothetical protein [Tanacetum cinerariifolium]